MYLSYHTHCKLIKRNMHIVIILTLNTLQWRHNERHGVSNHQRFDCWPNRLFRCRLKKTSKFCVTGFCYGNPPVTDGFSSQRTNAENVSIWWRHHDVPWNSDKNSLCHDKVHIETIGYRGVVLTCISLYQNIEAGIKWPPLGTRHCKRLYCMKNIFHIQFLFLFIPKGQNNTEYWLR